VTLVEPTASDEMVSVATKMCLGLQPSPIPTDDVTRNWVLSWQVPRIAQNLQCTVNGQGTPFTVDGETNHSITVLLCPCPEPTVHLAGLHLDF
jgi:hypothetical protein